MERHTRAGAGPARTAITLVALALVAACGSGNGPDDGAPVATGGPTTGAPTVTSTLPPTTLPPTTSTAPTTSATSTTPTTAAIPTSVPAATTSTAAPCPDRLSIAFFGALTGDAAALGQNELHGLTLAVEDHNAAHASCPVGIVTLDSQGDPRLAPGLARTAVDDTAVVAIVGPAFSGESRAAGPLLDAAGLPFITPSATNPTLSTMGWTTFHRSLGNDDAQGPGAAAYLTNTIKAERVAVVDDGSTYGTSLASSVVHELGGRVTVTDRVRQGQTDFTATVTKLKGANLTSADAIFFGGYYQEAGRLLPQLRAAGIDATLVAGDGVMDEGFVQLAGRAAEGSVFTCTCTPLSLVTGGAAFEARLTSRYPGDIAGTYAAESYDATRFILDAIERGRFTRAAINEHLGHATWTGITKTLAFDPTGELTTAPVYAYVARGGRIVPLARIG